MKIFKYIPFVCILAAFTIAIFCNCTNYNTDELDGDESGPVFLDIRSGDNASGRSTVKERFETGDLMGLFLIKEETNKVHEKGANLVSTYMSNGRWDQSFELDKEKLNVHAYYPHDSKSGLYVSGPYIIYNTTQNFDFLVGTHRENSPTYVDKKTPVVYLHLKHILATIGFYVRKQDYTGEGKVTRIEITNKEGLETNVIPLDVSVDLVADKVDLQGEGSYSIRVMNDNGLLPSLTNNYPETPVNLFALTRGAVRFAGDAIVTFTIDGKKYTWDVPRNTEWKSGYRYSYYVTISGTQINLDTVSIVELATGPSAEVTL